MDREGEAPAEPQRLSSRTKPVHGVDRNSNGPLVVFITVCTKHRRQCLDNPAAHDLLREAWRRADRWIVGRYVIMPDHVHLFAGTNDESTDLDSWVRYWKSLFTRSVADSDFKSQSNHWDTRMRSPSHYQAKWEYVRENPVRHRLVENATDWPFQGEIHEL